MRVIIWFVLLISISYAQNKAPKKKVIYKYKKYEKFDFENLNIEGDASSPGDLTISPRFEKKFRNRLPERMNFK